MASKNKEKEIVQIQYQHIPDDYASQNLKNSMSKAEQIIDTICERGGNHFYNKYLGEKLKPYSIIQRKEELHQTINLLNFKGELQEHTKDGYLDGLKRFPKEAWEPEDEGVAAQMDLHGPNFLKKFVPAGQSENGSNDSDNVSIDVTLDGQVRKLKSSSFSDSGSALKRRLTMKSKSKSSMLQNYKDDQLHKLKSSIGVKLSKHINTVDIQQMNCDSDSVVNRWVDNSPRADEIVKLREKKELEEKTKARALAKSKRKKGERRMVDKNDSSNTLDEIAQKPQKPLTNLTFDFYGNQIQIKKVPMRILESSLPNEGITPGFSLDAGFRIRNGEVTSLQPKTKKGSKLPSAKTSASVTPGQTARAGGDQALGGKRAKSENNKENKGSRQKSGAREIKAIREQEMRIAEEELSKKQAVLLKENQVINNGQLVCDLESVGVGVSFIRTGERGGTVQIKGKKYNESQNGRMSKKEFKDRQMRDEIENQEKMIRRARDNVIAIKEMARSGRSLAGVNTPGGGGTNGLVRGAAAESGLSLKTKLNSEFQQRSSVVIAREERNKIIMTPNALQNLVLDKNLIDSQEININFGYTANRKPEKAMFRYGGGAGGSKNNRSYSRASKVRDSLNLPSKDESKSRYASQLSHTRYENPPVLMGQEAKLQCIEPLKSFKGQSILATSTQMTKQTCTSPQKKPDFGINVSGSVRASRGSNRPQTAAVARAYHDRIQCGIRGNSAHGRSIGGQKTSNLRNARLSNGIDAMMSPLNTNSFIEGDQSFSQKKNGGSSALGYKRKFDRPTGSIC